MARSISSAEPEKLFRYSDVATRLDRELISQAHRLAATLQHFEATCAEPGYRVPVSHLAGELRSYSGQSENIDTWVRGVGRAFQVADWMGAGWGWRVPSLPMLPFPIPIPFPIILPTVLLPILPGVPTWLKRLLPFLPWRPKPAPTPVPSPPSVPVPPEESTMPSRFGELLRPAEGEGKQETAEPATEPKKDRKIIPGVPFVSQWDPEKQQGLANCGPACLAMIINNYGGAVTVDGVAKAIRGKATGHTDFKSDKAKGLLSKYGLKEEDVKDLGGLLKHLDQEHPVIMLVDNKQYIREENGRDVPYPDRSGFWDDHIVVVTGYERGADGQIQYVYINDPLAIRLEGGKYVADPEGGANFRVPIDDFKRAAANEGWYGAAVFPE